MIVFRYLAREVMVSMIAVSAVLLLIIMSSRFVKYLADAAAGKLAPEVLFAIMGFRLPGFLELILPLGLFIAFLLAYGRLYMDSEMTVLSACGVSERRIMLFSLFPALFVAGLVATLSLVVSPLGIEKAEAILKQQKNRSEFEHMKPARFQRTGGDKGITYADDLSDDRKIMEQVFMAEMRSEGSDQTDLAVVMAKKGEQVVDPETGLRYLKLHDGIRYSGNPGEANYQIMEFETYWQHLPDTERLKHYTTKADAVPTQTLMESSKPEDIAALHWRFSLPVLVLVVTLLAVPLSKTNPRQGRYVQMIPAILLYIVYLVSLNAARGAVEEGDSEPLESIWAVHGVFLLIALILYLIPHVRLYLRSRKGEAVHG
ncbi:LPS export ABC transporter permease LptF [Pseudomaricurvus alkylphenolicus]|uniref:LPS export ABC transporter permease LptF n=1 Tax=Pseudomaricurvus alkylphenolicus TaxID=1306991 RepID=UPI0014203AE0|nr:LPS export ABC transporter permease LptF [Pseudomaricurvus alkylphenolicus]NIB41540.1 LPS export ABC transporter permease LptF [Pseudomaricurvus alkylphenolicus]